MKTAAWTDCPGVRSDGRQAHALRDHCWSCAPYWERLPLCPDCRAPLKKKTTSGKEKCAHCGQWIRVQREEETP